MLTGHEILKQMKRGHIQIEPFDIRQLNPNSYNICLGKKLKVYDKGAILDLKTQNNYFKEVTIPQDGFILLPNTLYLGHTKEVIGSDRFIPNIDGRSSIGRLGMQVHLTAGFGDIGFHGTFTLEITVVQPVRVYQGFQIGQVYFEKPDGKVDFLYNGRYQDQRGPTESRSSIDDRQLIGYHYDK